MSESSCQGTVARPTFPVQRAVASTVALTQAASGTLRANKFIEECAESLANDRPGRPDESGAREADAKATRPHTHTWTLCTIAARKRGRTHCAVFE